MRKSITSSKRPSSRKDTTLLLLDTHVAVWLASASPRLKPATLSIIEDAFHRRILCLSPIAAWEIGLLVAQDRLDLGLNPLAWFESFVQKFNINVLDFSPEVAISSSFIPGEFHRDPADRILVATAIAESASIVTADRKIVDYGKQGFVSVIAC